MAIADLIFIDESGLSVPDYPTILDDMTAAYKLIYGADTYLDPDSQDGEWVAINALAIHDVLKVAQFVYNSYSPLTAQNDALSRGVKTNGLRRLIPSKSSADLVIIGQAGTTIIDGKAEDVSGQKWSLPSSVTIPLSGTITVTSFADKDGSVIAASNAINKIATPFNGWQSVNNPLAATVGAPVESDAALRRRQAISTALPSLSVLDGIKGAVASVAGVTRYEGYENDKDIVNADGLPPHSIAILAEGGNSADIANAISLKKTPGTTTVGNTSVTTYDSFGIPNEIKFYRPTIATVSVELTIQALEGYSSVYASAIAESLAGYINALRIGGDILISRLYVPASIPGPVGQTYNINLIRIKKNAGAFASSDIVMAFNELSFCDSVANVSIITV
jgi:uncharacterized phage protein gp47/JayE